MNTANKIVACEMKLNGTSIYDIAEAVKLTPPAVFLFFQKFPHTGAVVKSKPLDVDMMLNVCTDYIMGDSVSTICKKRNLTKNNVLSVFDYLNTKKAVRLRNEHYPTLVAWMVDHGCTLTELTDACHIPILKMRKIMHHKDGHRMDEETAATLSKFTGLTVDEIMERQPMNGAAEELPPRRNGKK